MFQVGSCGDSFKLWYGERTGASPERRYFSFRHVARTVAKLLREGKLDFDRDEDFRAFH